MAAPQNEYAFDYEAMRQAAEHWRLRDQERERKARAVRGKRYDEAETKDRLTKWVNRTLSHVKGGVRAHPEAMTTRLSELVEHESYTEDEIDNDLVERVIGETRDFLAVAFLERAVQAMRSVGRIETRLGNGRKGYGTGFLVSPHLLLTNHHVLKTPDHARTSVIEFDYQVDRIDQPLAVQRFALDPDAFFLHDEALDFALVAVAPTSARGRPLADYGWCPLVKEEGKIRIGECINIVQHPRGEMKQVVIRENSLLDLPEGNSDALDRFAHYEADTEPGSSGSPVFNDLWEVVALHHSGVPKTDAQGRFLDTRGHVWEKGDDPLRLAWVANEGIRVSRLVKFIEKAHVRPHEVPLRAELLRSPEPSSLLDSRSEIVADGPSRDISILPTSGTMSITIPLQISVRLGTPTTAEAHGARAEGKPEPVALEAIEPDPDYQNRPGYDSNFLGFPVPLPKLTNAIRSKAVVVPGATGPERYELKYHHFSVIMNGERRLALMAAVNYDASAKFSHTREKVPERWITDPRIDGTFQSKETHYAHPDMDRGHLVRRADAGWGSTPTEAKRANDDTFHFTNCSPQHEVFNEATRAHGQGLRLWGNIEEHIAQQARQNQRRLCIFNGPIFRRDDPTYRGLQVPREFWKVVVFENDAGEPVALAFRLTQTDLIKDLPPEEFEVGPYQPFQVTVRTIEEVTKLDFGTLRDYDPLEDEAHESLFEGGFDFVPLTALRDIVFGRRGVPAEPSAAMAQGTREVDQQITETISNAPAPYWRWNGIYGWQSRFTLWVDLTRGTITATVKIKTEGAVTPRQKDAWKRAIEQKWSHKVRLRRTDSDNTHGYPVAVVVQYVESGEHYRVTANQPGAIEDGRAGLGGTTSMTGWGVDDTIDVTHEFGHMLGCLEEYFTTNGIDYTEGGRRQGLHDPDGGVMNNPSNDPLPRNYDLLCREAGKAVGRGISFRVEHQAVPVG